MNVWLDKPGRDTPPPPPNNKSPNSGDAQDKQHQTGSKAAVMCSILPIYTDVRVKHSRNYLPDNNSISVVTHTHAHTHSKRAFRRTFLNSNLIIQAIQGNKTQSELQNQISVKPVRLFCAAINHLRGWTLHADSFNQWGSLLEIITVVHFRNLLLSHASSQR